MFDRIDKKLKGLAKIIFWLSVIIGGIWLLFSLKSYGDYAIVYFSFWQAFSILLYPISIILFGIVTSYLIYGFGELINHVRNIDYGLKGESRTAFKEDNLQVSIEDNEI